MLPKRRFFFEIGSIIAIFYFSNPKKLEISRFLH